MREVIFIQRNKEKWKKFEALFRKSEQAEPDLLADSFVALTDDLSYARTFYPTSSTVSYLNNLAFRAHQLIYVNRKESGSRIVRFWKFEFPWLMHQNRRFIKYSFLIFALAVLIGAVSAANDDRFVRLILGDRYVNMTLENIADGDPMAVYKSANESDMFLGITWNNVTVMFRAFTFGILFSIGTVLVLFQNGIMLGSFQYFFHAHGLLYESFLTIWIHGTIEIFSIVISGAAGLSLGNRLLFPGTYSRMTSLKRGAMEGLKTAIGLFPFIVIAGFLESFVTRHTDASEAFHWTIILGSAAMLYFYFFAYPNRLYKRMNADLGIADKLPSVEIEKL